MIFVNIIKLVKEDPQIRKKSSLGMKFTALTVGNVFLDTMILDVVFKMFSI